MVRRASAALALAGCLAACQSGPGGAYKRRLNAQLAAQDYVAAEQIIRQNKDSEYGRKNAVLYHLDLGTVLHHEGNFKASDDAFDQAELRMQELYTQSVTKAVGTLVLNDTTVDYAGEPFERTLTNVYRAMDWLFQGRLDEALVESRKVGIFLDELNRNLQGKDKYKDDAFAQYLSALLYADSGKDDDARISMESADKAYAWYAADYGTPRPDFGPQSPPQAPDGELVFIHFNGVAPLKISKTLQVAWNQALATAQASPDTEANGAQFRNALAAGVMGRAITVAYPEYQAQHFAVRRSRVSADSGGAPAETALMEDIQAIATKTLHDRIGWITARAVARAAVKYVIAEAAAKAAAKGCDSSSASGSWQNLLCKGLASAAAHGLASFTEIADTRCWGALPAQIRMARLRLPAGPHKVTVDFEDAAGAVLQSRAFDVTIQPGKRAYLSYRTSN